MNDTTSKTVVFGLTKIEDGETVGWVDATIEGGPAVSENPYVGSVAYGRGPLGYDQHIIHANSGAPVMGYCFDEDGELLVLGLVAGRWNLNDGQHRAEVPGGFGKYDPETGKREFPAKGALRELAEETGLEPESVVMIDGEPFIGDRAFFLKEVGEGNNVGMFELTEAMKVAIKQSPSLELMHWNDFQKQSPDGITLGSTIRLMGALFEAGLLKVCKA
ncbi:MAG TPA: NUDIX hydrolase [Patescibacteria group bacterium]|jgi:hypothetical protein|nr:NUDIX hydrolase [Patescibacteria group bacterium]